jgi:serine/threonine protein kinase
LGISLHHLRNQDDYEIIKKLGSGRYSGAFEGINVLNNNRVTIKILKKGKFVM